MRSLEQIKNMTSDIHGIAWFDDSEIDIVDLLELSFILGLDDVDGSLRGIDRSTTDIQQIRKGTVLIIVTVGDDDTFDTMRDVL